MTWVWGKLSTQHREPSCRSCLKQILPVSNKRNHEFLGFRNWCWINSQEHLLRLRIIMRSVVRWDEMKKWDAMRCWHTFLSTLKVWYLENPTPTCSLYQIAIFQNSLQEEMVSYSNTQWVPSCRYRLRSSLDAGINTKNIHENIYSNRHLIVGIRMY